MANNNIAGDPIEDPLAPKNDIEVLEYIESVYHPDNIWCMDQIKRVLDELHEESGIIKHPLLRRLTRKLTVSVEKYNGKIFSCYHCDEGEL